MKTSAQQTFIFPEQPPFLEIRTTIGSISSYAEHLHTSFSFGLIIAGCTSFSLGGSRHLAQSGDIVLIAPKQVHSCNPVEQRPRSYHMAHIDADWFHSHIGMALYQRPGVQIKTPVVSDANLFAKAVKLIADAENGLKTVEHDLNALLLRMHSNHDCFASASYTPDPVPRVLSDASAANAVTGGGYTIAGLARNAGLRREYFSRFFHRTSGLPPSCYLHCLRLEYGRRLMQQGSTIAETAIATGYADQSHFHRTFVKYCSATPGCYVKNRSHPFKK